VRRKAEWKKGSKGRGGKGGDGGWPETGKEGTPQYFKRERRRPKVEDENAGGGSRWGGEGGGPEFKTWG